MADNRSTDPTLFDKMSSEVAPEVSPLLRFLLDNSRRIGIVMAVFVLAAAGYGVYNWHSGKQVADAQSELGRILVVSNSADRLAKLKAFLPDAPASIRDSVNLSIARTAAEAKDYAAGAEAWGEIAKDAKSPLYVTAVIGQVENLAMQGKTAEALTLVDGLNVPEDSAAASMVNGIIVDLAEKTGDLDKAIAACNKLVVGVAMTSPEEAEFWRQKAATLELQKKAANS